MPPRLIDPRKALQEARTEAGEPSAAQIAGVAPQPLAAPAIAAVSPSLDNKVDQDFRLFLTLLWRQLGLGEPQPLQLDMAGWLQHGPDRSVTMMQRGAGKSFITGGYGLWRLKRNPRTENILVVSASQLRAQATTTWMLNILRSWDFLQHLVPLAHQRSSSQQFDVAPAMAQQSASCFSLGIGGQLVGFRASCIIADDVESQTNSLTPDMREKIQEAVKEFDSVLKPKDEAIRAGLEPPVVRYLGTPHSVESLYSELPKRGYMIRIWPGIYPNQEEARRYGANANGSPKLAPYLTRHVQKNPELVGTPTMPGRFTADDLAKRRLSLGSSEFALQFNLDVSQSDKNKYPLKVSDLMVMSLDPRRGPESLAWTNDEAFRIKDTINRGFEGDLYYTPRIASDVPMVPYNRIVTFVDPSGRGSDETAVVTVAELNGILYLLHMWAGKEGFEPATLKEIADICVRFRTNELHVEENWGGGTFAALLRPWLIKAWQEENKRTRDEKGTELVEVKVSRSAFKEQRILRLLEPVTQQHRLVVNREVLRWDDDSLQKIEGEDTRHKYAFAYQFTHLTRDRDSLGHDDRVDALAGAVAAFAEVLGVDPSLMAKSAARDRMDEEWERIFGADDWEETEMGTLKPRTPSVRPRGLKPASR